MPHASQTQLRSASGPQAHPEAAGLLHDLRVELRPAGSLIPRGTNPRTHSPRQIRQIADSIEAFGFTNPVLIDAEGRVIAGHGRVLAARRLGIEKVPTIRLEHLSEAQIRAYVIADNKLAENAGWDRGLLALELQGLAELDFDLSLTGFETAEVDLLFEELAEGDPDEADRLPEIPGTPPVSRPGDLWRIGRHRLFCGDATREPDYDLLMEGRKAQMIFTDPPYNVPIGGHVSGLGRVHHREFPMASGEMSEAEFTGFLRGAFRNLAAHSAEGSIHFICMDWRHLGEILAAGREAYAELKNLIVWNKTNAGMGSFYRSRHELIFAFKKGSGPHINNFELGQHGRHRSNVWDYAGANTFRSERLEELALHPTVKPVALVADAILDCSRRGGIILDPFAGSGTILLAAERTGRAGCAMELDPRYVDASLRRLSDHTGLEAFLQGTGRRFSEVEAERAGGEEAR